MAKLFYTAKEISEMLGISTSMAYKLIRKMNAELEKNNFLVISGKVPIAFFQDKMYGTNSDVVLNK